MTPQYESPGEGGGVYPGGVSPDLPPGYEPVSGLVPIPAIPGVYNDHMADLRREHKLEQDALTARRDDEATKGALNLLAGLLCIWGALTIGKGLRRTR